MADLIDRKKDLYFSCMYQINQLVFVKDDEKIKMKLDNIISMEKLDDYEFNLRSILKLSLRLDMRQKLWIVKNKKDVKVKMTVDKVGLDVDAEDIILGPEESFSLRFNIYLNDDDDAIDFKSLEGSIKSTEGDDFNVNDIENESYFESDNAMDIYLFEPKMLRASNKTVNRVFTKACLQDMIGEILTETGHKKVLMSRLENDEVYNEMLVPSLPAYKALSYLDQYYGFYKRGSMIYYDLDKLYIINPNGKLTAQEDDEEWTDTCFLITSNTKTTPGQGMVRKPNEKIYYINIPEENFSPQKQSITDNETQGSSIKIAITDDIEISQEEANQSYIDARNDYIRYSQKDDNKYVAKMTKARMEENEGIMYISCNNVDINAFALNKTYKLIFEETTKQERYGKWRYRLAYAYHFMRMEGSRFMSSAHKIVLKKCSYD